MRSSRAELNSLFTGLLLGAAVGDSIGLPAEGLTRQRARKLFPGPWTQRLIGSHGMTSDDTDQMVFVSQALIRQPIDAGVFAHHLAWSLRGWFLSLPPGIGFATARACLKLLLGFSPRRSGVFSGGNGAAMRVAPIGAMLATETARRRSFVQAATLLTHTDPLALAGALAIAEVAAWIRREGGARAPDRDAFLALLRPCAPEGLALWKTWMDLVEEGLFRGRPVVDFATHCGLDRQVTGFVLHSVPVVLYAWHHHYGDFRATLEAIWSCGGDTDTTGAMAGALAGMVCGEEGIPSEWIEGIWDWPRGVPLLRRVAARLADATLERRSLEPVSYPAWASPLRNALQLGVVLAHGLRRLFPPY